jgi:dihydrofolate reductase
MRALAEATLAATRRIAMRLVRFGGAMSLDGYIAGPNGEHDWIVMDPEIDFGGLMRQFDTFLKELRVQPGKDIAIFGGGDLFRSLLAAGLVDRVEMSLIPVLLGGGIPLLPPPAGRATLKLRSQRLYPKTGTIGLEYEIVRA